MMFCLRNSSLFEVRYLSQATAYTRPLPNPESSLYDELKSEFNFARGHLTNVLMKNAKAKLEEKGIPCIQRNAHLLFFVKVH